MKKGFLFMVCLWLAPCLLQAQSALPAADTVRVRQLDEIVVTRAGERTPVTQTTVGREQIDESRVGRELPFVLNMLPSVVCYSDNGTMIGSVSFRIRGVDASRINVSVNGVPLNDAESQTVFWVNIPDIGAISSSLQVQRGVGTSPFGSSAFGGLLNIETQKPSLSSKTQFESSYGSFNTHNIAASVATGLIKNILTFDTRYEYAATDGYLERSGLWQQTLFANGCLQGKNNMLRMSVLYGEQHSRLTFDGVPADSLFTNRRYNMSGRYGNEQFYHNETDNYQQLHIHGYYAHQLGATWKLNASAYYTKGWGYYEQYKENANLAKYGIPVQDFNGLQHKRSDLVRQKGLDNDFYGINLSLVYESQRCLTIFGSSANRYIGDHYGKVLWVKRNAGDVENNRNWYDNTGAKSETNIFTKMSYKVLPTLSAFVDMQLRSVYFSMRGMDDDYYEKQPQGGMLNNTYNWLFFNPKVGIMYASGKQHNAFVSLAVGNREPNRSDLKDADKNGIRMPASAETMYDWETGYTYCPTFGQFGVTLYYMNYHNQIVATGRLNDAYRAIMENVPGSYRMGVELTAVLHPARQWQIEANAALSRNKLRNYTSYLLQYDENWNESYHETHYRETSIAYSPNIVAAAVLRWQSLPQLLLSFSEKYVDAQYIDNTQTASRRIDAYWVSNLQATWRFSVAKTDCTLQLFINNLFNAKYSTSAFIYDAYTDGVTDKYDIRYMPQADRNFMMKLDVKF